jgi:hypothetical protein
MPTHGHITGTLVNPSPRLLGTLVNPSAAECISGEPFARYSDEPLLKRRSYQAKAVASPSAHRQSTGAPAAAAVAVRAARLRFALPAPVPGRRRSGAARGKRQSPERRLRDACTCPNMGHVLASISEQSKIA